MIQQWILAPRTDKEAAKKLVQVVKSMQAHQQARAAAGIVPVRGGHASKESVLLLKEWSAEDLESYLMHAPEADVIAWWSVCREVKSFSTRSSQWRRPSEQRRIPWLPKTLNPNPKPLAAIPEAEATRPN